MDLRDFIIEFATRHNAQVPEAQEDGTYIFGVDQVLLALQPVGVTGKFFISAKLSDITDSNFEALKNVLLQANFFFQGTDGSVFALDPTFSGVYLQKMVDGSTMDYDQIEEVIQSFLNTTDNWVSLIEQVKKNNNSETSEKANNSSLDPLQLMQDEMNSKNSQSQLDSLDDNNNNNNQFQGGNFHWTSV